VYMARHRALVELILCDNALLFERTESSYRVRVTAESCTWCCFVRIAGPPLHICDNVSSEINPCFFSFIPMR
jgi:hypothetical protein